MGEGKQELQEMSTIEHRMPQPLSLDAVEDLLPRWKKFKQQFQIFLTAAGFERLSESRKAAILLNCIGADAQELYFNILSKDEDSQKYEEVLKAFDDYFTPKQNEVINAFIFNNRKQEEGESFDNFYTQIKKLVKNCAYNDMEDRMLRDRIVMGISDKNLQQTLIIITCWQCEKFYMTVEEAESACIQRVMYTNCSKSDKHLCKRVLQVNRTFSKMTACGLFTIDASLPIPLIGLQTNYIIVLLQFAFL